MKRYTRNIIYFTGSKEAHRRTIFEEDGRFYVKWYGQMVEVEQGRFGSWRTKEAY